NYCRCAVPGRPARVGSLRAVLLHPDHARRRTVSVRHCVVRILDAVDLLHARLRHAAPHRGVCGGGTGGGLLYVWVGPSWDDRVAGALSVVLFHLVPLPYFVLGNANLTNAFGASVSLVTMVAATIWFGNDLGLRFTESVKRNP